MTDVTKPRSPEELKQFVEALYEGPVRLSDLQAHLLSSAQGTEPNGPTPEKDQRIQEMVYKYVQSRKDELTDIELASFSPTLAWICVGSQLSKMLSVLPKSSISDLAEFAAKEGFDVEEVR